MSVIDGFIIDHNARKVVPKSKAKNYLSTAKWEYLCRQYIRDKDLLAEMSGVIVELDSSSRLFEYIDYEMNSEHREE